MARTVRQIRRKGKRQPMAPVALTTVPEVDTRIALIQALIPVGLEAFRIELQRELVSLVGERYARTGRQPGLVRWTPQAGSIDLGDQKLPITVPRVRDRQQNREVPLTTYQQFQTPRHLDTGVLQRVLGGLAPRE